MKIFNLTLSSVALVFALMILGISLLSASRVISYEGTQASCKKFYLGQEILPDHLLYPFVAVMDRAVLSFSPQEEKIVLKVNYGLVRYGYAQDLLKKGNKALALSTLTKSQKYFNLASHQALNQEISLNTLAYLIDHLQQNLEQSQNLSLEFTNSQRNIVDKINQQNEALLGQLLDLQQQIDLD